MPTWKKIIVSGSQAHLTNITASALTNDKLLIAGPNGEVQSSGLNFNGSTLSGSFNIFTPSGFVSASEFSGSFRGDGSGLTNVAATSFDIDALGAGTVIEGADAFIYSDGGTEKKILYSTLSSSLYTGISGDVTISGAGASTIGANKVKGTMLSSSVADGTTVTLSSDTLSVLRVPNFLSDTAGGGLTDFSYDGSGAVSIAVSGAAQLSNNKVVRWDNGANKFVDSSITDNGTTVSFTSASIGRIEGTVISGSFIGDGTGLTGISTTLDIAADSGTDNGVVLGTDTLTVSGTAKEIVTSVSGDTITVGIANNPTLSGSVTVTGDLIVNGTQTSVNTANLDIEDRYILLNSGSSTVGDSGIIFGGANGAAQSGTALVYDASYNSDDGRLGVKNTLAADATGDNTPNYYVAGFFEGTAADAATAEADHKGNIRVDSEGNIFIYS